MTSRENAGWLSALPVKEGWQVVRDGSFATLGFATHARDGMLTFLEEERWLPTVSANPGICAVITTESLAGKLPSSMALATSHAPRDAFYSAHAWLLRESDFYGALAPSTIAASAQVAPSVVIPATGIWIGEGVVIEANVSLFGRVTLEDGCFVRAGCVIGSDGFQVQSTAAGGTFRVPHAGGVRIRRGAEVRANSCVDRALFGGETEIGEDCTLDHLVYIAHDVVLEREVRIGAGAVVNGSVRIGAASWVGPNATIANGLTLGARSQVSLGSVVTRDVVEGTRVSGNFAVEHARFLEWLRSMR